MRNLEVRSTNIYAYEIVDLDKDGGEGQPLIVARVYSEADAKLFIAADGLLEACQLVSEAHGLERMLPLGFDPGLARLIRESLQKAGRN